MPSKPHFPKFSYLGFMCLVHEPESTRFWHDNKLISSCSRSFYGLVMAALNPRSNGLEKKGNIASLMSCHPSFVSHEK